MFKRDGGETDVPPMEAADDVFERAKEISAEIDEALAQGNSARVAELSRERRALRKDARVVGLDSERAWEELLALNKKLKKESSRGAMRIQFWRGGGGGEHHARTGTDHVFNESERVEDLRERKRELIHLLHEAGECDPEGRPIRR